MEVMAGYKKTEVGIIPDDWQVMTLAKVCKMKSGESITSANIDEFSEYPCFGGNGLRGFTNRFTHDGKYALVGRQGALCGNVLGVNGKFFASEHAVVVTPFEQTDIQWLTYVLEDMKLNQYSESSAQPGLSVVKILNLDLAVPPVKAEQEAIAEALSDADALIEAVEQLLVKKRQVKEGAMQELLTGKRRLSGFENKLEYKKTEVGMLPEDWKVSTLGAVCSFENGDRGRNYPSRTSFASDGVPFINAGHVEDGHIKINELNYIPKEKFDLLNSGKVLAGDIVFCLRGSLGKFGIVSTNFGDGAIASSLVIVRPKPARINREYLYWYFRSSYCAQMIDKWSGGAAQPNLGVQDLVRFTIPIPPTEDEQTAIAEILSDMDAEITALEEKLSKAWRVKQGMLSVLLGGRIRLI